MMEKILDAVVIGAGQAGLGVSYCLRDKGLDHVVLEKDRIGHSWRTQRWDSFRLNTPNKINLLPGMECTQPDPEGFCGADAFADALADYAARFRLPVREMTKVTSVERASGEESFTVFAEAGGIRDTYRSKCVIVASGAQNNPVTPELAEAFPHTVRQLHAAEYRKAGELPEGSVLVVGSAQSGVQVAEDLLDTGRRVFLCTSKVARAPRRYRGRDIMDWMSLTGFMEMAADAVEDPDMLRMKQPQISGVGPRGRTVSLQSLARRGAVILGRAAGFKGTRLQLAPNATEHIRFADGFSEKIKGMVDDYIRKAGLSAPPNEADPADMPDAQALSASPLTELDIAQEGIHSVIWATGFTGDFSYIRLPVFDEDGVPKQRNGQTDIPGLYFIGLPWLRKRKSGIVLGIPEDAEYIGQLVAGSLAYHP